MAAITYSTRSAPATRRTSGLPKPTENRSTLKPSLLATQKWPNSCTVTSRLTATTNHSAYQMRFMRERPSVTQLLSRRAARRSAHVPAVCLAHRSEEHTSELQSRLHLVCRLLLEKKKKIRRRPIPPATSIPPQPPSEDAPT